MSINWLILAKYFNVILRYLIKQRLQLKSKQKQQILIFCDPYYINLINYKQTNKISSTHSSLINQTQFMTSFDRSLKPIPNKFIATQPPQLITKQYNFSSKSPYNRQIIPQLVKYNPHPKQKKNNSPTHFNLQDQQNLSQQLYDNQFLLLDRSFAQSQYISKNQQKSEEDQEIIDKNIKFSFGGQNSNKKYVSNIQKIEEKLLNKYKRNQISNQNQQKNKQEIILNSSRFPKKKDQSMDVKNVFFSQNISKSNKVQKPQLNLNLSQKKRITQQKQEQFSGTVQNPYDMQLNLQDSRAQNQQIQEINDQILNTIYTANFRNKEKNYNFLTHQHTANSIDISSILNNNQKSSNTNINPLNLLHYSLLNQYKPTFIQDQAYLKNQNQPMIRQNRSQTVNNPNQLRKDFKFINLEDQAHIQWISNPDVNKSQVNKNNAANNGLIKEQNHFLSAFLPHNKGNYIQESNNIKNQNNIQQESQIPKQNQKQQTLQLQKMSLSLFTYYLGNKLQNVYSLSDKINKKNQIPNDLYESYLIEQDHEKFNEIHINQFIPSKQLITNTLTSRSTPPINNNTAYSSPYKILDKSYQTSISKNRFTNERYEQQNFIFDKKPEQIISSIMTNRQKLKLYLKYLQCEIAKCDQNQQGKETKKVYQILSCLLLKLNSVNQNSTRQRQNLLVQNIIKMFDKKSKSKVNNQISLKPTISLSEKGMKIQFDTYLSHKRKFMNERISYLKGLLQQKKSQEQLIKFSYDQVIHDYAQSLSNVAKSKQINSIRQQNLKQEKVKQTFSEPEQKDIQNMTSSKIFDMQAERNSLSLNHKMYRKATFGKAPSSMRNSNQHEQI